MRKPSVLLTATLVACSASFGLAACGESGGAGKKGGAIKVATVGPDSYDPVIFQTIQGLQPLQLVYPGLVTYKHAEGKAGTQRIPGLAERLPAISADGRTYRMRLRRGLRYSDGTPVKASDFEHTIKRLLRLKGPYASFFSGIVGADRYTKSRNKDADIAGIKTNDATGDITVTLTAADGKFEFALAEPYASPTPTAKSPFKNLTKSPPPGAGPYTLKVVDPSREFVLQRNPGFNVPGIPKGNVDRITGLVLKSVPKMTQDVINNRVDFMTEDPTGDLLPLVERKYKDRFRLDANPPNTYYFFLNVTTPPFDRVEARQAVNYGLDSRALERIFGGRLEPSCNFLPPDVIGYVKNEPCPYGDPSGPPNIAKAKQLVAKSGYKGMTVTVWGNNKDPRPAIVDYFRDMLNEIGFKAKTKILDQQVYFDQIGNKARQAQTGFTDWFQDFPHPADFFEPLLSGKALASTPTFNTSYVNDNALNAKIDSLTKQRDPARSASQWAALDKEVVGPSKAYVAVYGNEKSSTFMSERMNFDDCSGVHPVWKNDWLLFCLK